MQKYKYIIASLDGQTGRIILNRPELHNAMNIEMIREISSSFQYLNDHDDILFIAIEAKGPNFSSGADLNWMKAGLNQTEEDLRSESIELARLFNMIYRSKKVCMVLAKGKVMGGANGIIAAADISIASSDTSFAFTEVRLGLVPATIAPYIVSRTGANVAREWMLTGRKIDAREAYERGLINTIFPEENLLTEFKKFSDSLLKNGPQAMAGIKKMFREYSFLNPDDVIEQSAQLLAKFRISNEGQEGIKAFFDKRNPNWSNEQIK